MPPPAANVCGTCKWFVPPGGTTGSCIRYPPAIEPVTDASLITNVRWPIVRASELCGEWQRAT